MALPPQPFRPPQTAVQQPNPLAGISPQQRQNLQAFQNAGMTPTEVRALQAQTAQPFSGVAPPSGPLPPAFRGAAGGAAPAAQPANPFAGPGGNQALRELLSTNPSLQGLDQRTTMQALQAFQGLEQDLNRQTDVRQTAERPFAEFVGGTTEAQTGLSGATEAINRGASGAISALEDLLGQARGEIGAGRERALEGTQELFERGVAPLESLQAGAQGAQQQQAALSGALGPEAQAAAIAAFQESPQQAFLREQGERAITRNAAALGGLGGGEVRRELARFGTGLAAQDFANQFARLGDVANRGLTAAGQAANLGQGQAGLQTRIEEGATGGIANLLAGQGRDVASIFGGAGTQLAGLRERAGQNLAQAISGTTQGLANLTNQQGEALSSIFGEGAGNVANLFNLAGQGDAQAQQQLAAILTNLNQDEATLLANLFAGQGTARLTGDLAGAQTERGTIESLIGAAGNIFG